MARIFFWSGGKVSFLFFQLITLVFAGKQASTIQRMKLKMLCTRLGIKQHLIKRAISVNVLFASVIYLLKQLPHVLETSGRPINVSPIYVYW